MGTLACFILQVSSVEFLCFNELTDHVAEALWGGGGLLHQGVHVRP